MNNGLALAISAAIWARVAFADVPEELLGRPIVAIDFESELAMDEDSMRAELPLRIGSPLVRSDLDAAVEALEAKEIFDLVAVDVAAAGTGVAVTFRVRPSDLVVEVKFRGVRAVSEEDLRRRSRLRDGDAVPASRLEEASRRLEEFYASRGYAMARIETRVERLAAAAVRLEFEIDEGEPVRLERVDLVVRGPVEPDRLRKALPFEVDEIWSTESLGEGESALRRWLRRHGFFECDVASIESVDATRAIPQYTVTTGERSRLVVEGNQAIERAKLLDVLDLSSRPIITAGTWREMARRMRTLYQEAGFPLARVGSSIRDDEVEFLVDEGPAIRVTAIHFRGNRELSDAASRNAMESHPASRWPFGRLGTFVDDVFAEDLERIRERYRADGFLAARIVDLRFDLDLERSELRITIVIEEGNQSRLGRVAIRGTDTLTRPIEITDSLRSGAPYVANDVEAERYRLLDQVRSLGRPDARVTIETTIRRNSLEGEEVDVDYVVNPGPEVTVGRVVVQRNFYTHDRVVRRELDLATGDLLVPSELLEAQRRIYRLGLFRSVSVAAAETDAPVRDVHLRVAERPGGEVQYGVGYNTSTGVRNFLQIAHRNLGGTGRTLSLRGDVNLSRSDFTPDEYVTDLGARAPRLFEGRWDGRANVVVQRSEREVDEFSIDRFAVSSGVEREIVPRLQGTFLIELDNSRIFDVAPDAVLTGQDEGRLRTVSLNPILVFDGRDDAFSPSRGVFDSVRLRYAARAFGSDVGFVKLTAQHSQFIPLGRGLTWFYAMRGGIADVLEGASSVPLRERFFLGGRTTVRGFDENEIGPRGDAGNPIGGDLSINVNTEIRFPLLFGVDGAMFFDGGGLYLREQAVEIEEFREAAGPGLRYRTPIGSLSLDYGFKIDRRDGESIGEIHFSIGNLF